MKKVINFKTDKLRSMGGQKAKYIGDDGDNFLVQLLPRKDNKKVCAPKIYRVNQYGYCPDTDKKIIKVLTPRARNAAGGTKGPIPEIFSVGKSAIYVIRPGGSSGLCLPKVQRVVILGKKGGRFTIAWLGKDGEQHVAKCQSTDLFPNMPAVRRYFLAGIEAVRAIEARDSIDAQHKNANPLFNEGTWHRESTHPS